jgi:signal transduction histidine kinase
MAARAAAGPAPYAVAFVDIRMPPGIDGVETSRRLLAIEPSLQIVLCTAHSDYGWEQLAQALGASDRVLLLKKPFDPLEVRQLASALSEKSRLVRAQAEHVADLDRRVGERTAALERANARLLEEGREREEAQRRLADALRMQALGHLTAGMAHEINNPLACVRANLDLLEAELGAWPAGDAGRVEQLRDIAAEAIRAGDRIARVVRDVRLYASGHEGRLEAVDLPRVVGRALARFAQTARGVLVGGDLAEVPAVMADAERLSQVVVNLLSNAAQALPPGLGRDPEIRVTLSAPGPREVVIEVRDNGEGVADEHADRIFEPFFTTRPFGEGMGLGLAVSHGIVASFGGRISVASRRGEGTAVRVTLPVPDAPADAGAPKRPR